MGLDAFALFALFVADPLSVLPWTAAASTRRLLPTPAAPRVRLRSHPFFWLALSQVPWACAPLLPAGWFDHGVGHVVRDAAAMLFVFGIARLVHLLDGVVVGRARRGLLVTLYVAATLAAVAGIMSSREHVAARDAYHVFRLVYAATLLGIALRRLVQLPPLLRPAWDDRLLFGVGIVLHGVGWLSLGLVGSFGAAPLLGLLQALALSAPFVPPVARRPLRAGLAVFGAVAVAWGVAAAVTSLPSLHAGDDPHLDRVLTAASYLVFALVWVAAARAMLRNGRGTEEPGTAATLFLLLSTSFALSGGLTTLLWLAPSRLILVPALRPLFLVREWLGLAAIGMACHAVAVLRRPDGTPSGRWVAFNYACPGAVAILALGFDALGTTLDERLGRFMAVELVYQVGAAAYVAGGLFDVARRTGVLGRRSGGFGGQIRPLDVVLFTVAIAALLATAWVARLGSPGDAQSLSTVALLLLAGLAVAAPIALRVPGEVARTLIAAASAIGVASLAALVGRAELPRIAAAGVPRIACAVAVIGLAGVVLPLQRGIRDAIEAVVFRRARERRAAVRRALADVLPDAGVAGCCARAVEAFVAAFGARIAGVRLTTGETFTTPGLSLDAWPAGAGEAHAPTRPLIGAFELRGLAPALRTLLAFAGVTTVVPLRSPRRAWGHLVVGHRQLESTFQDDDLVTVSSFARELALLLDAADLVAQTRAVERALAHAEKLAAVGEAAARIAHDVRNPVTAARSLAQQLVAEPDDPYRDEHRLILGELDRVERHVAALLRFSRRDDPSLGAVQLAAVVRDALGPLAPHLADDDVALTLDVADGAVVRGDADALRNVVVNLIENARDALRGAAGPRRLHVALEVDDRQVRLRVHDSGPGVPPDALARLFEPFFSLKPNGTGLGLAIAKRAVEAHGGSVRARRGAEGGLEIAIELPRWSPA